MTTRLQREKTRHNHPRKKKKITFLNNSDYHKKNLTPDEIQYEHIIKGKSKKYYGPKREYSPSANTVPMASPGQPYRIRAPLGLELCPYIRNPTKIEEGIYDGTCILTKRLCQNHHAYKEGAEPGCLPYNLMWHPKTEGAADFIRNAKPKDLLAYITEQTR